MVIKSATNTVSKSARKLLEFFKLCECIEKRPGFTSRGHGLSWKRLSSLVVKQKDDVDAFFISDGIHMKWRIPSNSSDLINNNTSALITHYMSLMDDVTTWALVLGDDKRNRAGVSVNVTCYKSDSTGAIVEKDEDYHLELETKVTKIGNKMGFVNYQVLAVPVPSSLSSPLLLCYGSHIKYLPQGLFADFLLSNWWLIKLYTNHLVNSGFLTLFTKYLGSKQLQKQHSDDNIIDDKATRTSNIFDSLQMQPTTNTATFTANSAHASLGGPIHGGCQAVLMEMAATPVAQKILKCTSVQLNSISVDYMSPPSREVELQVEAIGRDGQIDSNTAADNIHKNNRLSLRVSLIGRGKVRSQGVLHFSPLKAKSS